MQTYNATAVSEFMFQYNYHRAWSPSELTVETARDAAGPLRVPSAVALGQGDQIASGAPVAPAARFTIVDGRVIF